MSNMTHWTYWTHSIQSDWLIGPPKKSHPDVTLILKENNYIWLQKWLQVITVESIWWQQVYQITIDYIRLQNYSKNKQIDFSQKGNV